MVYINLSQDKIQDFVCVCVCVWACVFAQRIINVIIVWIMHFI